MDANKTRSIIANINKTLRSFTSVTNSAKSTTQKTLSKSNISTPSRDSNTNTKKNRSDNTTDKDSQGMVGNQPSDNNRKEDLAEPEPILPPSTEVEYMIINNNNSGYIDEDELNDLPDKRKKANPHKSKWKKDKECKITIQNPNTPNQTFKNDCNKNDKIDDSSASTYFFGEFLTIEEDNTTHRRSIKKNQDEIGVKVQKGKKDSTVQVSVINPTKSSKGKK